MDSKTTNGDLESYPNKHPRSPVVKSEPIEAPSGDIMTAQAQPVELDPKPRANSSPFPSWMSRYMTPNAIHLTLQILSIITFCSLLVPYMQYSRAKKAANNEICMQDAQTLYVNNLTQCEVKTATSLRGGVLGLNWVEMALLMAVAAVWQYAAWFAQGWLIVRISFLKKDCKE